MSIPKIAIKNTKLFFVNDKEEKTLDIVIVGANPKLSKSWYKNEWNPDIESCIALVFIKLNL